MGINIANTVSSTLPRVGIFTVWDPQVSKAHFVMGVVGVGGIDNS